MDRSPPIELIALARSLGDPANDLCILAEGNVSCEAGDGHIWVKASGANLASADQTGFVLVDSSPILAALDSPDLDVASVRRLLNESRIGQQGEAIPSTETFMHAVLLELDVVGFVAHSHPTALLSILCRSDAQSLAARRLFPDEIVCCGPAACFVPYAHPGFPLAIELRIALDAFRSKWGMTAKTIWLQNHGLIALGKTAKEAMAASLMSVKAARVLGSCLRASDEVRWLSPTEVSDIVSWPDEHFRQKLLRG